MPRAQLVEGGTETPPTRGPDAFHNLSAQPDRFESWAGAPGLENHAEVPAIGERPEILREVALDDEDVGELALREGSS